jgi:hypothetical protein
LIATNFDKIVSAAKFAGDAIKAAMDVAKAAIDAVVGAVSGLLDLLGSIGSKIGSIAGHLPFMAPAPPAPAARGLGAAPLAATGGINVQVHGSLDPEGTARAILRVLQNHDRRHGLTL